MSREVVFTTRVDWRAKAKAVYDAWTKDGDFVGAMHELGACLKEEPDCEARRPGLPDARCSLARGHESRHRWTPTEGCAHPRRVNASLAGDKWQTCTACGVLLPPLTSLRAGHDTSEPK